MKQATSFLLSVIAAVGYGVCPSDALAQNGSRGPDDNEGGFAAESPAPALAPGHVARYRVTYMKSNTAATALRTATVVSITNQSLVTCGTSVDFKIGFGGTACTTNITLAPGETGDHCSRTIPSGVTTCNATCAPAPGLAFAEGSAIVGSSILPSRCSAIAVSARTYYTQSLSDAPVSAITDAKVVRIGAGNAGD